MLAPSRVLAILRVHPAAGALGARVQAVAAAAYRAQRPQLLSGDEVAELSPGDLPELARGECETEFGNALEILDRGASTPREWLLLGALWALGSEAAGRGTTPGTLAAEAMWLTTQTELPALLFVDATFDAETRLQTWQAVATAATSRAVALAERVTLATALFFSTSEEASSAVASVSERVTDPTLALLFSTLTSSRTRLSGELAPLRGRLRTVFLAISGLLFVASCWRLFSRFALGFRRRGSVTLKARGLSLQQSTELLGKRIRSAEKFVPFEQLASIRRETRHANTALYIGIATLALGTYVGTGLLADAVRVPGGSPSLLGLGLLAIALGLALDFLLFRVSGFRSGAARVVLELRKGRGIVLRGPSEHDADEWIGRITRSWD